MVEGSDSVAVVVVVVVAEHQPSSVVFAFPAALVFSVVALPVSQLSDIFCAVHSTLVHVCSCC